MIVLKHGDMLTMIELINSNVGSWIGGVFLGLIIYKLYITIHFLIIDAIGIVKIRRILEDMGVKSVDIKNNPHAMYFLYKCFSYSSKLELCIAQLNKEKGIEIRSIRNILGDTIAKSANQARRVSDKGSDS